jgi:putative phage-type endonuclease
MIERYAITDRAAWLALRAVDLTASDIGAACGLDPYKTPLMLYAEKTGLLLTGGDNPMMRRGRWFEPAAVEAIRDENPDWQVEKANVYLRDPDLRLGATPDALAQTDEPGLTNIQIKVVAAPEFASHWSERPPLHYLLQTITEGLLLNAARSKLAALVVGTFSADLHIFDVPRHAAAEQRIMQICMEFWENIRTGKRPAADYERDAETVAALYPQSVKEPVLDLTGDNLLPGRLIEREVLKAEIAVASERVAAIDTEIKDKMGEAAVATLPGWTLKLPTITRKEYTVAEATYRRLTVTKAKEEKAA